MERLNCLRIVRRFLTVGYYFLPSELPYSLQVTVSDWYIELLRDQYLKGGAVAPKCNKRGWNSITSCSHRFPNLYSGVQAIVRVAPQPNLTPTRMCERRNLCSPRCNMYSIKSFVRKRKIPLTVRLSAMFLSCNEAGVLSWISAFRDLSISSISIDKSWASRWSSS